MKLRALLHCQKDDTMSFMAGILLICERDVNVIRER